jgi:hypothetical protein
MGNDQAGIFVPQGFLRANQCPVAPRSRQSIGTSGGVDCIPVEWACDTEVKAAEVARITISKNEVGDSIVVKVEIVWVVIFKGDIRWGVNHLSLRGLGKSQRANSRRADGKFV